MVHVQPHRTVQVRHRLTGHWSGVAFASDEAAYYRTVFLLYPRLVVLAVRTRAGELDASLLAATEQLLVDEHAIVVGVDATDRDREDARDRFQPRNHQGLLAR